MRSIFLLDRIAIRFPLYRATNRHKPDNGTVGLLAGSYLGGGAVSMVRIPYEFPEQTNCHGRSPLR
ncbi:MAG: hypothetical protein BGO16_12865 [Nitrobacter sp. 62-23]|nr:MAG: hypothetical protein BGO16_12865 [Nitrobacter sp. 62-23]